MQRDYIIFSECLQRGYLPYEEMEDANNLICVTVRAA